jgi:integrase
MGLKRRNGFWWVRFKRYGQEFSVSTRTKEKRAAKNIDDAIALALRLGDHCSITDPESREVAGRLFGDRIQEFLPGFTIQATNRTEKSLTLWEACRICDSDPDVQAKGTRYRERLRQCFAHLIQKLGKESEASSIKIPDVKRYRNARLDEGASEATVNREVSTLSKIFQVLIENEKLDRNPVRGVRRLPEESGRRKVYLSASDFETIVAGLPDWHRPLVLVGYYTGMRQGEVRKLKRDQVDLDNRVIWLYSEDTKERKPKPIPIHENLVPVLAQTLSGRVVGLDYVFLKDGQLISRFVMHKSWMRTQRKTGIENPITWHDLRHVFKRNARRSGISSEVTKDIMGHWRRSENVSERYDLIDQEDVVEAIDALTVDHGNTVVWTARRKKQKPTGGTAGQGGTKVGHSV